jgi:DNA invertase Pin-like site-specific DNA recombinase
MSPNRLIPVAQYLRMSTEHQRYSLENQAATIHCYAMRYGFEVVRTYSDGGRSGLLFKNRPALNELLRDVISGNTSFNAVLVYDVSRWGRFQDTDEAAHYEFLCKHAGIPIHYCAEDFQQDSALTNTVMKAVKRAMAAEFSRELGEKVFNAESRWAELGFKQGGAAGFGLQRVMVSATGLKKQVLAKGEAKCLQNDRVVSAPGDPAEVEVVREIYRLVVEEKKTPYAIALDLNQRGVFNRGKKWGHMMISRILSDPKYAGAAVWNRSSRRLGQPNTRNASSEWIIRPGAFDGLITADVYEEAQRILNARTCRKTNEEILRHLGKIFSHAGKLSGKILQSTPGAPSVSTCRKRFGSLKVAFRLASKSVEPKQCC